MDFKKFVYNNVTRNFKSYLGYYFSCTVSVMLFFVFAMATFHPAVVNMGIESSSTMGLVLTVTESIIAVFSLLFIIYSMGTFVKSRYREFGTLMILGMSNKQFKKFVLLENLIIGLISIISGIVIGFIFAKPFLILISKLFKVNANTLYLPINAIILTLVVFMILFIITSPTTITVIKKKDIIELLNGSKKPKSEPKASIVLSLLSIVLIIGGYIAILLEIENVEYIVFASIIVGTYIFFNQFTVFIFKKIKENKKFYLNKTNVLWVSNLVYKVKDNARLLFLTSVLLSGTLVSISSLASMGQTQLEASKQGYPFAIFYMNTEGNSIKDSQTNLIEKTLDKNNYSYKKTDYEVLSLGNRKYLISNSEFNKVAKELGYKTVNLSKNETVIVPGERKKVTKSNLSQLDSNININNKNLDIVGQSSGQLLASGIYNEMNVVSDDLYNEFKNDSKNTVWIGHGYNYKNWESSTNMTTKLKNEIISNADKAFGEYEKYDYQFFADLPGVYATELESTQMMLFIGTFVGIIFFVGSCSFLYFRFYTDLVDDKEKYKNLSKLGLSYKEMKKILNIEISSIFFIPYFVATLNALFGLVILNNLTGVPIGIKGVLVPIVFFIIYFVYFLLLKSKYIKSIAKEIPTYLD